jgi:DNA-binding MarR family transcriptional regulator
MPGTIHACAYNVIEYIDYACIYKFSAKVQGAMSVKGSDFKSEWRELQARHARVTEALERELQRKHRLSVAELDALQCLAANEMQSCRLQQLTDDVHMSQSALSRLIGRLETEGLVERRSCSEDRRGIFAVITEAGLERLAEAEPTQAEILSRTL